MGKKGVSFVQVRGGGCRSEQEEGGGGFLGEGTQKHFSQGGENYNA